MASNYDFETLNGFEFNVSVLDLLNFGGPNLMKSGDEVWKAGHVLNVGVTSVGLTTSTIEGLCLQSSHPTEMPHIITLTTADDFRNWKFVCSCKAGLGSRCKHIYAVLLHIHTERKIDVSTCTQQRQKWVKIAKEAGSAILEPERIRDMPEFANLAIKKYVATECERELFKQRYLSDPKGHIAIFKNRYESSKTKILENNSILIDRDDNNDVKVFLRTLFDNSNFHLEFYVFDELSKSLMNFYKKRICITKEESLKINLQTTNQNSHLWRYERQLRVTASECYTLYTGFINNADMPNRINSYCKPKPLTKNMKIGRAEETNALKAYKRVVQNPIVKLGLLIQPSCPWIGCSPDSYSIETGIVVEVKTLINEDNDDFEVALKKAKYLRFSNGEYFLREKHKYYAQAQVNLFLLKSKMCHLVVYNYRSDEIRVIEVKFDEVFVKKLFSVLYNVYFSHMLGYVFEKFVTEQDKQKYK